MNTKAYIMIHTSVGTTRDVSEALRSLPGIESVDIVTGPYDIIAVCTAEDLNVVGELVSSRIHSINGIAGTLTCFDLS